jgi:hypothetical protein
MAAKQVMLVLQAGIGQAKGGKTAAGTGSGIFFQARDF